MNDKKVYEGLLYIVNVPPRFLEKGTTVIVDEEIKTLEMVLGNGDSHLQWQYKMYGDEKLYCYNDLWMFVIQPILPLNRKIKVWFEYNLIKVKSETTTIYNYMSGDENKITSKTSICVYLTTADWKEALKLKKGIDRIKFRVYFSGGIPATDNSKSRSYYAKLKK